MSCATGSPPPRSAGPRARANAMSPAESCCHATGSTGCSTRAARSSSSSPLAAEGLYGGDSPGAGIITGIGLVHGPAGHGRLQRRHRQGRHVLPDDGEEAPPRPGGREGAPAAVRLPRRLGRRVPADAGRGVPRPRALRADLLQPGAAVVDAHPAAGRGPRLVHGRRRVRAGDERRDGDRARPGHHLPRRPAPREGGDRRGRHPRGARRRRPALAGLGRHRPPRRRRRARPRARARHGGDAARAARAGLGGARVPPAGRRPVVAHGGRPGRRAAAVRRARGHRPARRRQRVLTSSSPSTATRWSPGSPTSTGTRSASSRTTACCSASPP